MLAVSVLITFYNDHDVIQKTLASVFEQETNQLFYIKQVILVDDGSAVPFSGYSGLVPEATEFLVFRKNNGGVADARNFGLKKVECTDFLAFLDADDIWLPNKTAVMVSAMLKHKAAIAGCLSQSHLFRWSKLPDDVIQINFRDQLWSNCFLTSTVILDLRKIQKDELYFPNDKFLADEGDLFNRVLFGNVGILCNRVLIDYSSGKAPFGESGVSSKLLGMQLGELRNYRLLHRRLHINFFELNLYVLLSILKFLRRIVITFARKVGMI